MSLRTRWPEGSRIDDQDTRSWSNELIRSLSDFESRLNRFVMSETSGAVTQARQRESFEVSSGYALSAYDDVVLVDANTSSVTVTMPTAASAQSLTYDVKRIDNNAAFVVSVEGSGVELPIILNGSGRPSVTLYSDGNNFWII